MKWRRGVRCCGRSPKVQQTTTRRRARKQTSLLLFATCCLVVLRYVEGARARACVCVCVCVCACVCVWRFGRRGHVASLLQEGHANDAIALEISCFRHAENRTFSDVVSVIMPVILQLIPIQQEKASVKAIQSTLTKWAPLLRKFVQGPLDEATVVESVVHYCNGATPTVRTCERVCACVSLAAGEDRRSDTTRSWLGPASHAAVRRATAHLVQPGCYDGRSYSGYVPLWLTSDAGMHTY